MARNVRFELRRGAGSPLEVLFGKVSLTPTMQHSVATSVVLPAPTTFDLINGIAVATNVAPSPAPVAGTVEWAYIVKIVDTHGKSFEYMVGVPDGTSEINFNALPKYFETKPPLFGEGPQGIPGSAATVAVGSVTSGPTPAVSNTGTSKDAVLNFTLPKGDKGDTGAGVAFLTLLASTNTPGSYPLGLTYMSVGSDAGTWPLPFAVIVTDRQSVGRTTQIVTSVSGTRILHRTEQNNVWTVFKEFAWNDLATPLLNGLMPALDKAKLDGMTPTANSKTFAALASTYPTGFSTLQVRAADGWPIATTGTVVTQKTSAGNGGVGQWLYPEVGGAPQYRVSDSAGNWGNFDVLATDTYVDAATAGVVREVTSDETYYVSLTGSDANTGLSSATAFRTINKAVAQTQNKTYATDIKTIIILGAGTYAESVRLDALNTTRRIIHIKGPTVGHPNVPTAIVEMAVGNTSSGLVMRDPNLELIIEDVKFKGFNGNSSAAGIAATGGGVLRTINVHAELCFWGITCSRSVLDVTGGIFTNNGRTEGSSSAGAAIRSLMLNNHSIGTQYGSLAQGPIFRQNYYGVLAQESSVGHVDYCTFEDNDYGLLARVNSRANAGGSVFNRNIIAVQATGNSYVLLSEGAHGTGANANGTNVEARSGGVIGLSTLNAYIEGVDNSLSAVVRRISATYTPIVHNTATAYIFEHVLPPGWWDDNPKSTRPAKKLMLRASGTISGSTSAKSLSVRLGVTADNASIAFDIAAGATGAFVLELEMVTTGPTSQYLLGTLQVNGVSGQVAQASTSVDMRISKQLRLAASAAGSGDSITVKAVETYVEG